MLAWLVGFVAGCFSETESQVAQVSLELTVCDLRLLTLLGLLPKPGVTGVACHTQYCSMLGLNPGLHACRQALYPLSYIASFDFKAGIWPFMFRHVFFPENQALPSH